MGIDKYGCFASTRHRSLIYKELPQNNKEPKKIGQSLNRQLSGSVQVVGTDDIQMLAQIKNRDTEKCSPSQPGRKNKTRYQFLAYDITNMDEFYSSDADMAWIDWVGSS